MQAGVQGEFGPTWYAGMTPLPEPRAALNYELDVDVCVIGGGLAGLTVAREVVRRGWSVVVLEAKRVAWNASGRNSGFVLPGFPARIENIIERIGLPATKALWTLSEAGVQYVRNTVAELGLAGGVEGEGWLEVSKWPDPAQQARVNVLTQDIGAHAELWPQQRVRDVLRSNSYFGAIHHPGAFVVNPLAYALGLAAAAERAGAFIFEHTPALSIDPAGVRKRIVTPQGRVRAGRAVLAGNIGLGAVAQRVVDTLVPMTAYTGVTKPLGQNLAEAIAFAGAVSDTRHSNYHYRVVDGDRLMWTGGASVRPRNHRWMAGRFASAIRATYPQLGPVEFENFWSGDIGFAVHRMPQVGEVQPGVWLASAFGGQGLNGSAMAGELIARAIIEGDDTWRAFIPYEMVWAGGAVGRAVVHATTRWWQMSEAVAARMARRREGLQERRTREQADRPRRLPRPAYRVVPAATLDPPHAAAAPRHVEVAVAASETPSASIEATSAVAEMPHGTEAVPDAADVAVAAPVASVEVVEDAPEPAPAAPDSAPESAPITPGPAPAASSAAEDVAP
jgi:gamma-glutamylputrescine oxidase